MWIRRSGLTAGARRGAAGRGWLVGPCLWPGWGAVDARRGPPPGPTWPVARPSSTCLQQENSWTGAPVPAYRVHSHPARADQLRRSDYKGKNSTPIRSKALVGDGPEGQAMFTGRLVGSAVDQSGLVGGD